MYRMKLLLTMLSLILLAPAALAVDFRWTLGFGQGTLESTIKNANDSAFTIYCPQGHEDTTPGMFLHVKSIKPTLGELVTVQFIVDGKNHSFYFQEIRFKADTRANQWALRNFVNALLSSKQKSFVAEFPKYNTAETFSLLNVRDSIGADKKKGSILKGCGEDTW
jgi:hypothetical protein